MPREEPKFKKGDLVRIDKLSTDDRYCYRYKECLNFIGKVSSVRLDTLDYNCTVKFIRENDMCMKSGRECDYHSGEIRKLSQKEHDRFFLMLYRDV